MTRALIAAALAAAVLAPPAAPAGEAWDGLRPQVFGERAIAPAGQRLSLSTPYRSTDDASVEIGARIALPEGARATRLTLIIDENPVPVSAVVDLAEPRRTFRIALTMRLNGPSPVRALVETADGRLMMRQAMVKTSGQGACAAPPGTDPEAALATLGEMRFRPHSAGSTADRLAALRENAPAYGRLSISHPSHSGLQMDQVTLLYLPAHYVETVAVREGGEPAFTLTGSISLSENPEISFPHAPGPVQVRVTDSEGNVFERTFGRGAS